MQGGELFAEEFNPKFLFAWKNVRNEETLYHCHDYLELHFVMSGGGTYRIDGRLYQVSEGDIVILNPGTMHQLAGLERIEKKEVPNTAFLLGAVDFRIVGKPDNHIPLPEGQLILHTMGELRQRFLRICSSMESENAKDRPGKYYMMKTYLVQILLLILRQEYDPVERNGSYVFETVNKKYVVEQILDYFAEHYAEKISLDRIAANMYLSPFYISKIFKSETGDTPIRYLINIRLEQAYKLLQDGWKGSVQDVAAAVGYEDSYHFSKLFKKKYGVAPSHVKGGEKTTE